MLRTGLIRCGWAAGAILCAGAAAHAEPIGSSYKVVRSGQMAPMAFHYSLFPDCRSRGRVAMNLVSPPGNGEIFVASLKDHPSYPAGSAETACNRQRVQGTEVYYKSAPGFTGTDSYVIERVFPGGNAQLFKITVSVR